MRYGSTMAATFVSRENRFVATVDLDGERLGVHVKNTGRCRELLVPGAEVILSDSGNPGRRYRHDLVAVYKGDLLVNIDSQAPNAAFREFVPRSGLFGDGLEIHPEHSHGDSRFDFYIESEGRRAFVEVKGVTLEEGGVCMFPDAPTERGRKHLRGLEGCVAEGYEAYVAFVIQMSGMREFRPNRATDPGFAEELARAEDTGVGVLCLECDVREDGMELNGRTVPHVTRSRSSPGACSPGGPAPPAP